MNPGVAGYWIFLRLFLAFKLKLNGWSFNRHTTFNGYKSIVTGEYLPQQLCSFSLQAGQVIQFEKLNKDK